MQLAVVRLRKEVFLVRKGNLGERRIVIEAMSDDILAGKLKLLEAFANGPHPSLEMAYIPHPPLAIAKLIAEHFKGEMIGYTRHVGPPHPDEANVVY